MVIKLSDEIKEKLCRINDRIIDLSLFETFHYDFFINLNYASKLEFGFKFPNYHKEFFFFENFEDNLLLKFIADDNTFNGKSPESKFFKIFVEECEKVVKSNSKDKESVFLDPFNLFVIEKNFFIKLSEQEDGIIDINKGIDRLNEIFIETKKIYIEHIKNKLKKACEEIEKEYGDYLKDEMDEEIKKYFTKKNLGFEKYS